MTSALFRHIEALHGEAPWGDFLDAGTGVNSATWSRALPVRSWTGVSGAADHLAQVRRSLGGGLGSGRLVLGNWMDAQLLAGETYDTILADYLVGAVESFSPYYQAEIFNRLRPLARGRLYVVGLDPYVVGEVRSEADRLVRAIGRLRDAVLLLADETPYREYPAEWAVAALRRAGFKVLSARRFSNRYRERWIHSQLDMAAGRLPKIANGRLVQSLGDELARLRDEAVGACRRAGGLKCGFDYVIAAEVSSVPGEAS